MDDFQDAEELDVTLTKRRIRGHKSTLTSVIKQATNNISIANSQNPPSSHVVADLLGHKGKMAKAIDNLEQLYQQLIINEDDEGKQEEYETALAVQVDRYTAKVTEIAAAIARGSTPEQPPASAPRVQSQAPRVEVNKILTPEVLNKSDSPVQMANWIRSFKRWYAASKMHLGATAEQQGYFMHRLDAYLQSRLNEKIQVDTPIFRNDGNEDEEISCIELLEKEFLIRYPIVSRQHNFFLSVQQQGQAFSDWAKELRQMGDEARLDQLTTEDLYIMRYICGTIDAKLREKFLKEPKPTLALFNEIVDQHEAANSSIQAITNPMPVYAIQNRKSTPDVRELEEKGLCFKCGNNHSKYPCKVNKETRCRTCGIGGHLERVCQKQNAKANAEYRKEKENPEYKK